MPQSYASLVIMNDENKFLTLHHFLKKQRPWRFAGGKIEPGEMSIVAAARELQEELGVEAHYLDLIATTEPDVVDGNMWKGHYYHVKYSGELQIMEPEKMGSMQWLTVDELKERESFPEYAIAEMALHRLGKWPLART